MPHFITKFFVGIKTIPDELSPKFLPSLNGLRAISILIVIYRHAFWLQLKKDSFLNGDFGVSIFFIVSGFLITTLLLKEQILKKTISLKNFFIRRALRILPLAYTYLLLLLILDYFGLVKTPVSDYLSGFFFYHNWYTQTGYINHYWSLSVEEQFYIIFPFLLKQLKLKHYVLICISLAALAPVITYFSAHSVFWQDLFYNLRPLIKFQPIAIGSLMAIIMFTTTFSLQKYSTIGIKLIVLGLAIAFYKIVLPAEINTLFFAAFMAIFIVLNLYNKKDFIFMLLNNRLLNYLGLMSYSLYIWQQLFTLNNMPWRNAFSFGDSIMLNLILLFIVSYISYNYYERFFLRLKERFA